MISTLNWSSKPKVVLYRVLWGTSFPGGEKGALFLTKQQYRRAFWSEAILQNKRQKFVRATSSLNIKEAPPNPQPLRAPPSVQYGYPKDAAICKIFVAILKPKQIKLVAHFWKILKVCLSFSLWAKKDGFLVNSVTSILHCLKIFKTLTSGRPWWARIIVESLL